MFSDRALEVIVKDKPPATSRMRPQGTEVGSLLSPQVAFHSTHARRSAHAQAPRSRFPPRVAAGHPLGCDAGVVGARDPDGVVSVHPLEADQYVLSVLFGACPMQRTGDVRRGMTTEYGSPGAAGSAGRRSASSHTFVQRSATSLGS